MRLILKPDLRLEIINKKPYIESHGYHIPVSRSGALFLCLLDGERTAKEAVELMASIGLCNPEHEEQVTKTLTLKYGPFIMEYDGFEDNPNKNYDPASFLRTEDHVFDPYNLEIPKTISFHVTSTCNKECRYCYLDAKRENLEKDALTFEEVVRMIDEAAAIGVYKILYTGGEPFLRKDLLDIIEYASSKGIFNDLISKFYLSQQQIERLSRINNLRLCVSYDCHLEEIASYLTGEKDHVQKMDDLIRRLAVSNVDFTVNPVITQLTVQHFEDFLIHLNNLKVKKVIINKYSTSLGRNDDTLLVSDEQWIRVVDIAKNCSFLDVEILIGESSEVVQEKANHPHDYRIICTNGRTCLLVLPNGKTVLCDQIPNRMDFCFGDLKKNSIMEIWSSRERQNLLFPPRDLYKNTSCYGCSDFDRCHKKVACTNTSLIEFGTAYIPIQAVRNSCVKYEKEMVL